QVALVAARSTALRARPGSSRPRRHAGVMGAGSGVAMVGAVLAVVGGAVLLAQAPAEAPALAQEVPASTRVEYDWPSGEPTDVLHPFAAPPEPWAAGHRGADLAMAPGADVLAAADGVVAFAGVVAGRGVVSIDHTDGVRTTYEPVAATVRRGEQVLRGQVVGALQDNGHHCAPEPCLHWGARRGSNEYLDPMLLLEDDAVIRLLP